MNNFVIYYSTSSASVYNIRSNQPNFLNWTNLTTLASSELAVQFSLVSSAYNFGSVWVSVLHLWAEPNQKSNDKHLENKMYSYSTNLPPYFNQTLIQSNFLLLFSDVSLWAILLFKTIQFLSNFSSKESFPLLLKAAWFVFIFSSSKWQPRVLYLKELKLNLHCGVDDRNKLNELT